MPTYDYRCDACGHAFEKFQPISAAPLRKCPNCGRSQLRRLIGTGAGVIFKGGGFYETDYRSESYKAAAKQDSGGDASGSDTGGKEKGAKPAAAKSEAKAEPAADAKAKPATGGEPPKKKSA